MNKREKQTAKRNTNSTRVKAREKREAPKSLIVFLEDVQKFKVTCAGRTNEYGIGAHVPKGACAYKEERGEWTAASLGDAKQMAEDFASNMLAGAKE